MLRSVWDTVQKYHMMSQGDKVLVGLSGGADSVCLLRWLVNNAGALGITVCAAHINHGLRGADADADEEFCADLCNRLSIQFIAYRAPVAEMARQRGKGTEEAGRAARYECFDAAAKSFGANKAALAHNRHDNAETIFMRLSRGTGIYGLAGIAPVRGDIIRPLLNTSREEIEEYLRAIDQSFVNDKTNASPNYIRNVIRNEVFPYVNKSLGISMEQKLEALSRLCADEEDFLSREADKLFYKALADDDTGVSLRIDTLKDAHPALIRRVIRKALSRWTLVDIYCKHIDQIVELVYAQSGVELVVNGVTAGHYHQLLHIYDKSDTGAFAYALEEDKALYARETGKHVLLTKQAVLARPKVAKTVAFCYDSSGVLLLRNRRPGDFIRLKNVGRVKIKDYFINNKTPRYLRDTICLLSRGSEVICVLDERGPIGVDYLPVGGEMSYIHLWED
ncbi:MAG: tRNA lysidine(34) synthetase TilS [Clostridiales bacterium]|jgi:tRNA(Ile)-lysidine synthase|nr:tRNA lysidine(34) synthetase TilS [Clostridiales bacterium]